MPLSQKRDIKFTNPNIFVNLEILLIFTAHNGFYLRELHITQEFSRGQFVTIHTNQTL